MGSGLRREKVSLISGDENGVISDELNEPPGGRTEKIAYIHDKEDHRGGAAHRLE